MLGFGFGFSISLPFAVADVENLSSSSVAVAQPLALCVVVLEHFGTSALALAPPAATFKHLVLLVPLPVDPALTARHWHCSVLGVSGAAQRGQRWQSKEKRIPLCDDMKALKRRPAKDSPRGSWPRFHPAFSCWISTWNRSWWLFLYPPCKQSCLGAAGWWL